MNKQERLSSFLLGQIEMFGIDDDAAKSKGNREAEHLLEGIAEALIEGREAFTGNNLAILERALRNEPEITESQIDRVLSRYALSSVPGVIKRLTQLSKLEGASFPSKQTAVYVREAARTYLCGFYQASAALSRAALEQALKERLGLQQNGEFLRFKDLLKAAEKRKIVKHDMAQMIRETTKDPSGVLHKQPTNQEGAFQILYKVRGFLQEIYSSAS